MIEKIVETVCLCYNVTPEQLTSHSKKGLLPEARRMVALLIINNGYAYKDISLTVSRHRTYVYWALKTIEFEVEKYEKIRNRYQRINSILEKYKSINT